MLESNYYYTESPAFENQFSSYRKCTYYDMNETHFWHRIFFSIKFINFRAFNKINNNGFNHDNGLNWMIGCDFFF